MKETFILSDYKQFIKGITERIGFHADEVISLPSFENDSGWHDWTTQLFKNNKVSKLIIPVSIPTDKPINIEGLKIALHIRLNFELSLSQRLIPIILLSDFKMDLILKLNNFDVDNNPHYLLFTKGIYLSSYNNAEINKAIEKAEPCFPEDYQKQVLNKLKILEKASTGKHSIANAWGCFKLAQVTGLNDEIFNNDAISGLLKTFYAKYLICYTDAFTKEKRIDLNTLKCNGKKVLFVDDQSDEGWFDLMKNIFRSAENDFVSVNSEKYKNKETKIFHDFEGFYDECCTHIGKDWDLIIIDLRLNPEKEDADIEMISPTDFSGYKLIDEFLSNNEGYQIIVSTASNKIWNINAALDRGASSYYVKESPEFNYSINETNKHYKNFKNDVQKCFDSRFLWHIYESWKETKDMNSSDDTIFINESNSMLDIAWSLIKLGKLDFGFLTLFQIIELYANKYYDYSDNTIKIEGAKQFMIEPKGGKFEWKLRYNIDKTRGDYFSSGSELKKDKISVHNLFKASCVLSFIFKKEDNFLKRFGELNEVRNKIAHKGPKDYANSNNIIDVLDILKSIRGGI